MYVTIAIFSFSFDKNASNLSLLFFIFSSNSLRLSSNWVTSCSILSGSFVCVSGLVKNLLRSCSISFSFCLYSSGISGDVYIGNFCKSISCFISLSRFSLDFSTRSFFVFISIFSLIFSFKSFVNSFNLFVKFVFCPWIFLSFVVCSTIIPSCFLINLSFEFISRVCSS